jgi:RNA recognition motif-containing protein
VQLKDIFEAFAAVKELRIIRDKVNGSSRGFGFVEYVNVEDATRALKEVDGMLVDGRQLKIAYTHRGSGANLPGLTSQEAIEQARWLDSTYSYHSNQDAFAIVNSKCLAPSSN